MQTEIKTSNFGAESGHWYSKADGGLVREVPSAKGDKMVKPTLRHAKKFGLVPSVTSVLGIIDKPNLNTWKIKEHIRATLYVKPKGKDETFESYCERVAEQMNNYNDHASVGTNIHAEIAKWHEGKAYDKIVQKTIDFLLAEKSAMEKRTLYKVESESEKPFASERGFGGTVDFKFITDKEVAFIDFKSADDEKLGQGVKLAYKDSHLAQLVAYDMGTNINPFANRRYINVFIGRFTGEIYVHEWTDESQIKWARDYFNATLNLYKIAKGLN